MDDSQPKLVFNYPKNEESIHPPYDAFLERYGPKYGVAGSLFPYYKRFAHEHLQVTDGDFKGYPADEQWDTWQEELLTYALTVDEDGCFYFNEVLMFIAAGNGKTTLASGVLIWFLVTGMAGKEEYPHIFLGAGSKDQTKPLLDAIKIQLDNSTGLEDVKQERYLIKYEPSGSYVKKGFIKALANEGSDKAADGISAAAAACDEIGCWARNNLWGSIRKSQPRRTSSICFGFSTAGWSGNPDWLGYQTWHDLAAMGNPKDLDTWDTFCKRKVMGVIFTPDHEVVDPLNDEQAILEANPLSWARRPQAMSDYKSEIEGAISKGEIGSKLRYLFNTWPVTDKANPLVRPQHWHTLFEPSIQIMPGDSIVLGIDGAYRRDSFCITLGRALSYGQVNGNESVTKRLLKAAEDQSLNLVNPLSSALGVIKGKLKNTGGEKGEVLEWDHDCLEAAIERKEINEEIIAIVASNTPEEQTGMWWFTCETYSPTNGRYVSAREVTNRLLQMLLDYDVLGVWYDQYGIALTIEDLEASGAQCFEVGMTPSTTVPLSMDLSEMIANGLLLHGGDDHDKFSRQILNARRKEGENGWYITKRESLDDTIGNDAAMSLLCACLGMQQTAGMASVSVYDRRYEEDEESSGFLILG